MNNQQEIEKAFRLKGLLTDRMISASKTYYRQAHPDHKVLFNANIFVKGLKKVWWGDLDITREAFLLQAVADEIDKELIIVPEMYGRFGAEDREFKEIMEDAYVVFTPGKKEYLARVYGEIEMKKIGKTYMVKAKGINWEKIKIK